MRMEQMTTPDARPTDEYRTSDLGLASFLVAKELPLLRAEEERGRVFFVFPGSAGRTAMLFYQAGANLVDARRFHLTLRELRGLTRGASRR